MRSEGEMSVRMIVSVNDSRSECFYDIDAAESLVIVHGKQSLAEV